jgi:hypothetical protein
MGFTPARAANAASFLTLPGWDQATRTVAAVTGPIPVRVAGDLSVEGEDPLGQPDCLGAGGRGGQVLLARAPAGDLRDLPRAEPVPGVDAEAGDADQGGQGVHGPGPLPGELIPGGEQDLGCRPVPLVQSRGAQLLFVQGKNGCGDAASVDQV